MCVGYVSGGWNALIDALFPREPVSAQVERDPGMIDSTLPYDWERYDYVVPLGVANLPSPPRGMCRERYRWAAELGGVDTYRSKLRVYLQGKADADVIIDGAAIEVDRRPVSRRGTHVACAVGAAALNPVHLSVDLDRGTAHYGRADEPKRPFLFTLSKGERTALEIQARTRRSDVRWSLELNAMEGDDRHVIRVDDDGKPFRTMAPPPTTVMWDGARWRRAPELRQ